MPAGDKKQQHQAPTPKQAVADNPDWDKKIIKNATLSVEVKAYTQFNDLVRNAVKQSGGYIAREEQSESDYKVENSLTIKVPVDQFDNTVLALTPGKEKILVKRITSQDVTGEVVDTKSRLEAKRQVRLRYLDLLKQAKTWKRYYRYKMRSTIYRKIWRLRLAASITLPMLPLIAPLN
nr:DUF4349 domain-containing protein [Paraflavitalea speifideiaquila]